VNSDEIMTQVNNLARGDQIKIKGKLVNAIINPIGKAGVSSITWNTSISRTDSGAGACEVIYVEDIQILREANIVSRILFRISSYGLLLLIAWNVFKFFMPERASYYGGG
jgi:hypothetical protein